MFGEILENFDLKVFKRKKNDNFMSSNKIIFEVFLNVKTWIIRQNIKHQMSLQVF